MSSISLKHLNFSQVALILLSITSVVIANDDSQPSVTNKEVLKSLRSEAAASDMPFFTAFLDDFNLNFPKYTSYMAVNHFTLPQVVADYYYHLAPLPQDVDLQSDIAMTFPFNEFQTFITAFPWYSSLLSEASASTIYVPEDFISTTNLGKSQSVHNSNSVEITRSSSNNDFRSATPSRSSFLLSSSYPSSASASSYLASSVSTSITVAKPHSTTPNDNAISSSSPISTSMSSESNSTVSKNGGNHINGLFLIIYLSFSLIIDYLF